MLAPVWELTSSGRVLINQGVVRVAYMNGKDQENPLDTAKRLRDCMFAPAAHAALITTGSALVDRYKRGKTWDQWSAYLAHGRREQDRHIIDIFILPTVHVGRATARIAELALSPAGPPRVLLLHNQRLHRVVHIEKLGQWRYWAHADTGSEIDALFGDDEP